MSDDRFTRIAAQSLLNTRDLVDWGIGGGHVGDLVDDAADGSEASSLGDVAAENIARLRRGIKGIDDGETALTA